MLLQGLATDENVTEMVAMWPVSGGDWIIMQPSGETVLVNVDAGEFGEISNAEHPAYDETKGLEQFQAPLEDAEMRAHVTTSQRQAAAARRGRPTPLYPARILSWAGTSLGKASSAAPSIAAWVRDAVTDPGVPRRRVVGRTPPGADEGQVLTAPFSGDVGYVWVVLEPGHCVALGVVVCPSRGSVTLKDRGVFLHPGGGAIPISRMRGADSSGFRASQIALFAGEDRGAGVGLAADRPSALRRAGDPPAAGERRVSLAERLGNSLPVADAEPEVQDTNAGDQNPLPDDDDEPDSNDEAGDGGRRSGAGRGPGGGGGGGGHGSGTPGAAAPGGGAAAGAAPDVRVLEVDYDSQGARFKDWKEVCNESKVYSCEDFPLDGPVSTVQYFRHMKRFGANPKCRLDRCSHKKGLREGDRNLHELEVLCEALFHFGSYDQLNEGASA